MTLQVSEATGQRARTPVAVFPKIDDQTVREKLGASLGVAIRFRPKKGEGRPFMAAIAAVTSACQFPDFGKVQEAERHVAEAVMAWAQARPGSETVRDMPAFEALFDFDLLGRLSWVSPAGFAWLGLLNANSRVAIYRDALRLHNEKAELVRVAGLEEMVKAQ